MSKSREIHFDVIKGLAIVFVVMGHILTMCIRDIDRMFLFKVIGEIHMPLFFFISGYFTFKMSVSDGKLVKPNVLVRFKQLMVPFFIVSTLWIYYFPYSQLQSPLDSTWHGLYFNIWKNGYWFTLCLFELILIYSFILPILNRCKLWSGIVVNLLIWLLLGALTLFIRPDFMSQLLGIELIFQFYPIFLVGIYAHKYKRQYYQFISKNIVITVSIISFALLLYYVCYFWEFQSVPSDVTYFARVLIHLTLAIIAIDVVKHWCENQGHSRCVKLLSFLGQESLAIYLLHYFFLFPMGWMRQPLIDMGLGFTPAILVALIAALAVIAMALGVTYVIKRSDLLAWLLIGKIKKS